MKTTYTDGPYHTFIAGVLIAECQRVALAADGTLTVAGAANAVEIGVAMNDAVVGGEVNVRLLGKGGSVRMRQSAGINVGQRIVGSANGLVAPLPGGAGSYRTLGVKVGPTSGGAASDIIEVIDVVDFITQ